jgi:hypothetical protein
MTRQDLIEALVEEAKIDPIFGMKVRVQHWKTTVREGIQPDYSFGYRDYKTRIGGKYRRKPRGESFPARLRKPQIFMVKNFSMEPKRRRSYS